MVYTLPAVIVGMNANGLGMVRSLALEGVPTIALDPHPQRPAMQTRYGRKLPLRAINGDALIEDLIALAQHCGTRPVLLMTQESTVRTVSEQRTVLAPYYRFLLPDHDLLMRLDKKETFQTLAEQHHLPVPRGVNIATEADCASAATLTYPCVIKPSYKSETYMARFAKAIRVNSHAELMRLYHDIKAHMSCVVVQEWVEGGDGDIYFCLQSLNKDSRVSASFVGRKIRAWPPQVGGTASCTAAPEYREELERQTTAFFQSLGYVGLGSMEYKRDRRSGRFVMIEPTVGRADFQEEVAALNGVNLPLAAYLDLAELPARIMTPHDALHLWRLSREDRWSAEIQGDAAPDLAQPAVLHDALWRSNDPLPWCYELWERIRERLFKIPPTVP